MTCDGCDAAAVNPWSGIYYAGCITCQARQVSHAPEFLRRRLYAEIADPGERDAFREAVRLEYERRQAWGTGKAASSDGFAHG